MRSARSLVGPKKRVSSGVDRGEGVSGRPAARGGDGEPLDAGVARVGVALHQPGRLEGAQHL